MLKSSYKYHLYLLKQKAKPRFVKKILSLLLLVIILAVGVFSSLMYWLYNQEAPLRAQNTYLEVASDGFNSTAQSINEVFETFQVAGAKTVAVDSLKEASASVLIEGYPILLQDIDKTVAKIESAKRLVTNKKLDLKNQAAPLKFDELNNNLLSFYDSVIVNLENSKKENLFAKDMLLAMGQNLYLPTISDETLWTLQNRDGLKTYYQSKKEELNNSLAALSKLQTPPIFKDYYQLQMDYLTKLAILSDEITKTLNEQDDKNPQNALPVEKAYQILNKAKKENADLSGKLLSQRLKAFDLKRNFEVYAAVKVTQNSLGQRLTDINSRQLEFKSLKTPQIFVNFFDKTKNFAGSLQIAKVI